MDITKNKYSNEAVHANSLLYANKKVKLSKVSGAKKLSEFNSTRCTCPCIKLRQRLNLNSNVCNELVFGLYIRKSELRRIGNGGNKTWTWNFVTWKKFRACKNQTDAYWRILWYKNGKIKQQFERNGVRPEENDWQRSRWGKVFIQFVKAVGTARVV